MGAAVLYMSMSADGFIAGPSERTDNGLGDGGQRLHEWFLPGGDPARPQVPEHLSGVNRQVLDKALSTSAVVAGAGTFEPAGGWGGDHHGGVPIFIYSRHEPRLDINGWPLVTYVSDVRSAITQAKQAAGDHDVLVHGAAVAQLALAAGVLDELELHVVPVLLGQGRRLFEGLGPVAHRAGAGPDAGGGAGCHPPALPGGPPGHAEGLSDGDPALHDHVRGRLRRRPARLDRRPMGQGGYRLFNWLDHRHDPGPSGQVFREQMATRAVIAGRRTYEYAGRWDGDHHDGVPVLVLTHDVPDGPPPGQVRYLTDPRVAAAQARAAAGSGDVMVHGAGAAQALLRAGELDELELHIVPVLLGQGRRLFDHLPAAHLELQPLRRLPGPDVTHLRYRVTPRGPNRCGYRGRSP